MVFVPSSPAGARALRDGVPLAATRAFAPTPTLRRTLQPPVEDEEADFAALHLAGVAALDGPTAARRLVLAAEVADGQVVDQRTALGDVEVHDLGWGQVRALFSDEDAAGPAVGAAAAAARDLPLAAALDQPAVAALTDIHDLLWYAPEELDALR